MYKRVLFFFLEYITYGFGWFMCVFNSLFLRGG